jgi:hypothetical protein
MPCCAFKEVDSMYAINFRELRCYCTHAESEDFIDATHAESEVVRIYATVSNLRAKMLYMCSAVHTEHSCQTAPYVNFA